jgi:flavin-dependent dehydrogenase
LPFWNDWQPRNAKGVLFVGDAGSFINAITGGGIYPAMMTGMYAAQHMLDMLDNTNCYPAYDVAWHPEIGISLRNARLIQKYIAPSAFWFNAILAITTFPPIKPTLLRALSGEHY